MQSLIEGFPRQEREVLQEQIRGVPREIGLRPTGMGGPGVIVHQAESAIEGTFREPDTGGSDVLEVGKV